MIHQKVDLIFAADPVDHRFHAFPLIILCIRESIAAQDVWPDATKCPVSSLSPLHPGILALRTGLLRVVVRQRHDNRRKPLLLTIQLANL